MKRNKIIAGIIILILLIGLADLGRGFYEYVGLVKSVEAEGSPCPMSEGGSTTKYTQTCVLDTACTPATGCTLCGSSCPMVTSEYATLCTGYTEMQVQAQNGTTFIAPPVGFQFKGKSMPAANDQFLACLAGGSVPLVIGLPSQSAMRAKGVMDFFDKYVVAVFK